MEGTIPEEIFDLTSLILLDLDNNNFRGKISQKFSELKSLEFLTIGNNDFDEQPLPGVFSELKGLGKNFSAVHVDVLNFNFSHLIFFKLQLVTLGIQSSKLTGAIPADYGDLTKLSKCDTFLPSMKSTYYVLTHYCCLQKLPLTSATIT